ncbi:MAG: YCF48-related protein [Gemmatimonadetes bacterium]|nr:YCF48-related protein [Gemmatimonadota bacterium]
MRIHSAARPGGVAARPSGSRLLLLASLAAGCAGPAIDPDPAGLLPELQWSRMNFGAASWKHDDVFFVDHDVGWAVVNDRGEIHKTEDGGATWRRQFRPSDRPFLRAIAFVDLRVGFAGNLTANDRGHALYRTTDGGDTWSAIDLDPRVEGICAIEIVNERAIHAVGKYTGPARFVKSIDGGKTWSVVDLGPTLGQATDLRFFNELEGVVVGGSSATSSESRMVVLSTSDGGETWTERYRGPRLGEMGWKLSFPTRDVGYASIDTEGLVGGGAEFFLKTEDGGRTWTRKPFYDRHYQAQGIGFISEDIGWIGSFREDRPSLLTTDGGQTWRETEFGDRVNRFRFLEDGTGFAAGRWLYRLDRVATAG